MIKETRWQDARVIQIIERTPRIKSFVFALARPFVHQAGQHVDLRLTAEDGYQALRSYSIASAPGAGTTIELAIERLDDGEVSGFFHDTVRVDDIIELRGPLGGHFVWSPSDGGPLLLAGGGSGVVPLVAMLRHRQLENPTHAAAVMVVSARNWDDVLYRDELLAMEDAKLRVLFTLTREAPRRPQDYGRRVDAAMLEEIVRSFEAPIQTAFVCGSNVFVNAVADGAVAAGVLPGRIKTERYGG